MGFKEIIMNNIQAARRIQSLTRGYFTRKTIRQNLETPPVPFSKLPDGTLIKMCSLLDLNTRLSLTLTSKQFSPLETGPIQTQSLGTTILQQLATAEAIQWINDQLQLVGQNPIELIKSLIKGNLVLTTKAIISKAINLSPNFSDSFSISLNNIKSSGDA